MKTLKKILLTGVLGMTAGAAALAQQPANSAKPTNGLKPTTTKPAPASSAPAAKPAPTTPARPPMTNPKPGTTTTSNKPGPNANLPKSPVVGGTATGRPTGNAIPPKGGPVANGGRPAVPPRTIVDTFGTGSRTTNNNTRVTNNTNTTINNRTTNNTNINNRTTNNTNINNRTNNTTTINNRTTVNNNTTVVNRNGGGRPGRDGVIRVGGGVIVQPVLPIGPVVVASPITPLVPLIPVGPIATLQPIAPPVLLPRDAEPVAPAALQNARYLDVQNNTGKTLRVRLLYVAETAEGKSLWLPTAGETSDAEPLTFEIEPGQTSRLGVKEGQILTSRVRIWVESETGGWTKYRDEDLILVDAPYQAETPEATLVKLGS